MSPIKTSIVCTAVLALLIPSAAAAAEPTKAAAARPAESKPLDLKTPDLRRLFTSAQLEAWANPTLPEYIEEVEVYRRRPSLLGRFASLFLPYTNTQTTNTRLYQVVDSTRGAYVKPVIAPARMAGEPVPYDR
jgi:hypothetical protein